MKKVVLVTGGFDPLHSGHIEYFKAAKKLGDKLVVGVNSDAWLTRKKGRPFMSFEERTNIVGHLDMVDQVIGFNDADNSACDAIYQLLSKHGSSTDVIFANGGDRNNTNSPEYKMYKHQYGLQFAWGVGGEDKLNSSSWVLSEWKSPKTIRQWGWYRVLDDTAGYKVKELIINPRHSLSDQMHHHRSEHWYILKGECQLQTEYLNNTMTRNMQAHDAIVIEQGAWHKASNNTDYPCHILEVQYGDKCVEEDIVRRD
jgi:cytidyltransferase-like protein